MRSLSAKIRYTPWFESDPVGIEYLRRRHDVSMHPRPIWFRLSLEREDVRDDLERCLTANGFRIVEGPPVELVVTARREGTPTIGGLAAARSTLNVLDDGTYESWATYIVRAPVRWLPTTTPVVNDRTRTAHDPTF